MSTGPRVRELTARARGAIRVLELCGPRACERLRRLVPGALPPAGSFAPVALRDARGELLDEALVLVHSDTHAELHVHGSPALVRRIEAELGAEPDTAGARSIEARAEEHLASAASEAAARVLLDQVRGAMRGELERLLGRGDAELLEGARGLAARGRIARRLLVPPRVVLAGPVNAGKSTLFNLLVGRERVVVDPTPGTTRDVVGERIRLGAYALDLHDTAGERAVGAAAADASVERAGQALAHELRASADLVLLLLPPGHAEPATFPAHTRVLRSLADLAAPGAAGPLALSALRAPAAARERVVEVFHDAFDLPRDPWTPGAAVPFEREWIETLAAAPPALLRAELATWLRAREGPLGPDPRPD